MRGFIEFVWAMHIAEVDLRPGKASNGKGEAKYSF